MLTRKLASISQSFPFTLSAPKPCSFFNFQIARFQSTPKEKISIQNLPLEVIAEIFTFCLPETLKDEEILESFPSIRAAPLSIAAVSRSWRKLALSLPRLWVRIDVSRGQLCCRDASSSEIVRTWLKRSGRNPLEFQLSSQHMAKCGGTVGAMSRGELGSFMELFGGALEHRQRWRSIHIEMGTNFEDRHRVELSASEMLLLEDLCIRAPIGSASVHINLSVSRRLRRLSLFCDFTMVIGRSPFMHLKCINLNFGGPYKDTVPVFMEDLFMILNQAPNLEELCAVVNEETNTLQVDEDMRFPMLRKLALYFQCECYASIESTLKRLAFPALEELGISVDAHLGMDMSLGIADLLSRSGASLNSLRLRAPSITDMEVLTCLYLSPSLMHLSLAGFISNTETIISILDLHNRFHSEPLCPELETLEFNVSRWHAMYKNFAKMVVSRWDGPSRACSRLREVRIREQDIWFVRSDRRVERCIKEGLALLPTETF